MATLASATFREPALKQSVLFPPIIELATLLGIFISEVYLRIRPLLFSIACFDCFYICGLASEFHRS